MKLVSLMRDWDSGAFAFEVADPNGQVPTKMIWLDSSSEFNSIKRPAYWLAVEEASAMEVSDLELSWVNKKRPSWHQAMDNQIVSPVKWLMEEEQVRQGLKWNPLHRIDVYGPLTMRKKYLYKAVPFRNGLIGSGALVYFFFSQEEQRVVSAHTSVQDALDFVPKMLEITNEAEDEA